MEPIGILKLVCKEANLRRDTSTFTNMDPYVYIVIKEKIYRSKPKEGAGTQPFWNETLTIEVFDLEDVAQVSIYDENPMVDDLIADCELKLRSLCITGLDQWYDLQYSGRIAGKIRFESIYERILTEEEKKEAAQQEAKKIVDGIAAQTAIQIQNDKLAVESFAKTPVDQIAA